MSSLAADTSAPVSLPMSLVITRTWCPFRPPLAFTLEAQTSAASGMPPSFEPSAPENAPMLPTTTSAPLELDEPLAVPAVPELLQAVAVNATADMATNTVIRVPRTFILAPRDEAVGLECGELRITCAAVSAIVTYPV